MRNIYSKAVLTITLLFSTAVSAIPDPTPDPDATVVYLRKSCNVANSDPGESPLENCFEKTIKLKQWILGNTIPQRTDPSARLLIEVGPGDHQPFTCPNLTQSVNLEFLGAGTDKTVMGLVWINHCPNFTLSFSDLTVKNSTGGNAVQWIGAGNSTWNNVILDASLNAWYDKGNASSEPDAVCQPGENGVHRFFSSRLISRGAATNESAVFLSWCGESWFWGSELLFDVSDTAAVGRGISSRGPASEIHLYGSNIRVEANNSTQASGSVTGIRVTDGAQLHVHGTGIDTIGKPGWTVTALEVATGGHIHANESSYVMQPATGATLKRIDNNGGHVSAPFQWRQNVTPPVISSERGADTIVVTSGTSDGFPHMLVYDDNCSSNWYDMTDKACYQ